MIAEHERVVLLTDLPEHGLKNGNMGMIVHVYRDGKGYEVELMALDGETIDVVTLRATQIRTIHEREIADARTIEAA